MSKKETEFDRYDRMKRMEKEMDIQKRKQNQEISQSSFSEDTMAKKGGKHKAHISGSNRKSWSKELDESEEYDFG